MFRGFVTMPSGLCLLPRQSPIVQCNHYIAHHNLAALCWGIALANRVFDAESLNRNHTIGRNVGAAVEAIDRVFKARSTVRLAAYQSVFARLRHGFTPTAEILSEFFADLFQLREGSVPWTVVR